MDFRTTAVGWIPKPGIVLGLALSISLFQQYGFSQEIILQIDGNPRQQYRQFMIILDQVKGQSEHRVQARIDDIHDACSLTDAQRKKLGIAAKGAVESHLDSVTEQLKKIASDNSQFDFDPGNPPESETGNDDQDNENPIVNRGRVVVYSLDAVGAVEDTKLWRSTVSKTLSEDQIQRLDRRNALRLERFRESAVAQYVADLDEKLFLSPEQLKDMTRWIDDNIGVELAAQMKSGGRSQGAVIVGNRSVDLARIRLDATLQKMLTRPQQAIWKAKFHQYVEKLRNQ